VSIILLFGLLLVASVLTDRALARLPLQDAVNHRADGAHVVVGNEIHQWRPGAGFRDRQRDACSGRPTVIVTLRSDDVIHSFWVPNLHGKKDLIPAAPR
jgi:cytochrome c oxidase subunit 2